MMRIALCGHEYEAPRLAGRARAVCANCTPPPSQPRRRTRPVCEVDGCERRVHARGMCQSHGRRLANYGSTDTLPATVIVTRTARCGHEYEGDRNGNTRVKCPKCAVCQQCGVPCQPTQKFCSLGCVADSQRGPLSCSVDGCGKPHRARGLCATHYNQARGADRHKPVTKPCAFCGRPCTRAGGGGRVHGQVCSDDCRTALTHPVVALPQNHPAIKFFDVMRVGYSECEQCAGPVAHDARWQGPAKCPSCRRKPRFVAGYCAACGLAFVADRMAAHGHATFCSKACGTGYHRRIRRRGDKRIGWRRLAEARGDLRCHICGDDCDPTDFERRPDGAFVAGLTYPSVDHIHPLSRGGSNDLDNLALAHMLCNSWKSNTVAA
jgi:hypothetical protein